MIYDKDIREPLFDFLHETFGKKRILEETGLDVETVKIIAVQDRNKHNKPIYAYAPEGIRMSYEMIISKEMFVEAYNRWIKEAED